MKAYRPSISPEAYARLAFMAAEMEVRPSDLLEKLIKEEWKRYEKTKKP